MPKPVAYDLSQISTHVITYSDRIQRGTKEDRATPACVDALNAAGLGRVESATVPESADALDLEIREAIRSGARFVLVLGGSGFGVGNYAPEVVRSIVEVEIPGIAEQIRAHGLANTPLSGLSREVVGVTARDASGALIISSPGSPRDLPPARRAALTPPPPLFFASHSPPLSMSHVIWVPFIFLGIEKTLKYQHSHFKIRKVDMGITCDICGEPCR